MHAMHFGFPIGAMIAPLIALPFVSDGSDDDNGDGSGKNYTTTVTWFEDQFPDDSQIEYAYLIIGLCIMSVGVLFVFYQIIKMPTYGNETKKDDKIGMGWHEVLSPSTWSSGRQFFGVIILICMTVFYGLHVGTMKSLNTYHALYAVDANFTTEREAAVLSSSTNFVGTLSRGLGILLAKFIPVNILILIFVFGECLTAILMPFVGLTSLKTYWAFCCIFAFFREPVWPCGYSWTDQYILLFAIIVGIGDLAGKMVDAFVSWVCGTVYTDMGIDSIFYVAAIFGAFLCVHLVIMSIYAIRHGTRFELENDEIVLTEGKLEGVEHVGKDKWIHDHQNEGFITDDLAYSSQKYKEGVINSDGKNCFEILQTKL